MISTKNFVAACAVLSLTAFIGVSLFSTISPIPTVKISPAPAAQNFVPVPAKPLVKAPENPRWSELNPVQRQALMPLNAEWENLESTRKQKWLKIASRYSSMKPDQQQRLQKRMQDWVKLMPEQRGIARENYTRTKKINMTQKSAQWSRYQQVPEEKKRKLAAEAFLKNSVANLPSNRESEIVSPWGCTGFCVNGISFKPVTSVLQTGL